MERVAVVGAGEGRIVRVAAISDIHDNIWRLDDVLRNIREDGADRLIVCGDLCAPFSMQAIAEGFSGPIDVVFGNNDGDRFLIGQVAARYAHVTVHGEYAELDINGKLAAVTHFPSVGKRLGGDADFAAVFYGHSHQPRVSIVGECLVINPGEVMGRLGRSTYALWDVEAGVAEVLDFRP